MKIILFTALLASFATLLGGQPVNVSILGKTQDEKVEIKSQGIAELKSIPKVKRDKYSIEVTDIKKIKGGVEVYARAWDKNGQIGFGDGSVDVERFVIKNPPILVPDDNGDVIKTYTLDGQTIIKKYREDLKEALLQSLEGTLDVKKEKSHGKIVKDKVGNTTLTAYPNAGTGSAPIDGENYRDSVNETFANIRANNGVDSADASDLVSIADLFASTVSGQYQRASRAGIGFDVSSVGSDEVSSATLSIHSFDTAAVTGLGDTDIDITAFTPTSESDFDGNSYNVAKYGSTRLATGKALSSLTNNAYQAWTFNSDGTDAIEAEDGNLFIGVRSKWDVDNSFGGVWASEARTRMIGYLADDAGAGTTRDPKLVVEHAAGASATPASIIGLVKAFFW